MGLVFVFVTITSPLHATAMSLGQAHVPGAAQAASMPGMSAECAKAMAAQAAKDSPSKKAAGHMGGGCCSNGCSCPLSHCPATPSLLTYLLPAVFQMETSSLDGQSAQALPSYLADTLKRPPRA
ncbi:hypothetical protein [Asticcacaulis sp. EMRT-3]|uniref:hypothetical protein n=1 Tax=Asticcacaulis sp. EMRT-3 TaxID=3040349 RepID=UPI0024AF93A8|nr:hypothetical protein [Asticcacaulis sp. EMRT-3]MDI7774772.1 hypothetical protein [Asticcacaulis sp. EMRT-3]